MHKAHKTKHVNVKSDEEDCEDKLQAENEKLRESLVDIQKFLKSGEHMVGHVYSAHPLSQRVCRDLDVAFANFTKVRELTEQALKGDANERKTDAKI